MLSSESCDEARGFSLSATINGIAWEHLHASRLEAIGTAPLERELMLRKRQLRS